MICDICGKDGAEIRYATRSYGKGANLLVIENIPVVTCPHWGCPKSPHFSFWKALSGRKHHY